MVAYHAPVSDVDLQQGFTLTEALIAISILAGIATAMGPALQGSFKLAQRIYGAAEQAEDTRIITSVLQKVLSGVVQAPMFEQENLFEGTTRQFQTLSYGFNHAKPERVFVSTVRTDSGFDLLLAYGGDARDKPVIILQAAKVEFSYLGARTVDETLKWYPNWQAKALPRLVRLTANFENSDQISDVNFDFLLQAEGFLTCQFDTVTRQCRAE